MPLNKEVKIQGNAVEVCHPNEKNFKFVWDEAYIRTQSWYDVYYTNMSSGSEVLNAKYRNTRFIDVAADRVALEPLTKNCTRGGKYGKSSLNDILTNSSVAQLNSFYHCILEPYFFPGHRLRVAVFHNVWANSYGTVVNPTDCQSVFFLFQYVTLFASLENPL